VPRLKLARKRWPSSALHQRALAGATSIAPLTSPSSGALRSSVAPISDSAVSSFTAPLLQARSLLPIALPFLTLHLTNCPFRFQDVAEAAQKDNVRVRGCVLSEVVAGGEFRLFNAFPTSPLLALRPCSRQLRLLRRRLSVRRADGPGGRGARVPQAARHGLLRNFSRRHHRCVLALPSAPTFSVVVGPCRPPCVYFFQPLSHMPLFSPLPALSLAPSRCRDTRLHGSHARGGHEGGCSGATGGALPRHIRAGPQQHLAVAADGRRHCGLVGEWAKCRWPDLGCYSATVGCQRLILLPCSGERPWRLPLCCRGYGKCGYGGRGVHAAGAGH